MRMDWYARHGQWFVGFKYPVRDKYLKEIRIPIDHFMGTSTRWRGEGRYRDGRKETLIGYEGHVMADSYSGNLHMLFLRWIRR